MLPQINVINLFYERYDKTPSSKIIFLLKKKCDYKYIIKYIIHKLNSILNIF